MASRDGSRPRPEPLQRGKRRGEAEREARHGEADGIHPDGQHAPSSNSDEGRPQAAPHLSDGKVVGLPSGIMDGPLPTSPASDDPQVPSFGLEGGNATGEPPSSIQGKAKILSAEDTEGTSSVELSSEVQAEIQLLLPADSASDREGAILTTTEAVALMADGLSSSQGSSSADPAEDAVSKSGERQLQQPTDGKSESEAGEDSQLDVSISIKDGGMSLLFALVPECEWRGGGAGINVRSAGRRWLGAHCSASDIRQ